MVYRSFLLDLGDCSPSDGSFHRDYFLDIQDKKDVLGTYRFIYRDLPLTANPFLFVPIGTPFVMCRINDFFCRKVWCEKL